MDTDDADALAARSAAAMRANDHAATAWGLEIEAVREGYAKVAMPTTRDMSNGYGMVHGGMIFALADTAFAYACNSRDVVTVAQHGSISFIDAGRVGERLVAEAREVGSRGRSGVYAVTVSGGDGRVVAVMQGLGRSLGRPVIDAGAAG